jgi:hypothetical protein
MNRRFMVGVMLGVLTGCGIQGPPVPPEDVGIAGVIQRQKEVQAKEEAKRRAEGKPVPETKGLPQGEPEPLPLEEAVLPSARPSGDVQVKPR